MPRPTRCRRVSGPPAASVFEPAGVPACDLEELTMTLDELEALRLADFEGLYQADGAARMGVSRATFGRVLGAARRKVAEALVRGKALRIAGGAVVAAPARCPACAGEVAGTCPPDCPRCQANHETEDRPATTAGEERET